MFRCFAIASGRTAVQGKGAQIDYTKDILLDHHSQYDLTKLNDAPYVGIHVIRDPRDLLVSCAFYHQKSAERWLHVPQDRLGGKTYQQHVNDLPTMEARLLFELENSGGENLRDMLAWDRTNQNFSELRYEDLIGPRSVDLFEQAIMHWPLSAGERAILMQFYRYFSLTGPGVKGNKHVRNPTSGQWRNHFTPAVEREFHTMFPNSINDLEYEA